jgi:hypothetical protein
MSHFSLKSPGEVPMQGFSGVEPAAGQKRGKG